MSTAQREQHSRRQTHGDAQHTQGASRRPRQRHNRPCTTIGTRGRSNYQNRAATSRGPRRVVRPKTAAPTYRRFSKIHRPTTSRSPRHANRPRTRERRAFFRSEGAKIHYLSLYHRYLTERVTNRDSHLHSVLPWLPINWRQIRTLYHDEWYYLSIEEIYDPAGFRIHLEEMLSRVAPAPTPTPPASPVRPLTAPPVSSRPPVSVASSSPSPVPTPVITPPPPPTPPPEDSEDVDELIRRELQKRRKNLIFKGLDHTPGKPLKDTIHDFLKNHLKLNTTVMFEELACIEKSQSSDDKITIKAKFRKQRDRKSVRYYSELCLGRSSGQSVMVDIPPQLEERRHQLLKEKNAMPDARRNKYHLIYTENPPFIKLVKKEKKQFKRQLSSSGNDVKIQTTGSELEAIATKIREELNRRKNNLVFKGLNPGADKTNKKIIRDFLREQLHLNLKDIRITKSVRVTKPDSNGKISMVVKFQSRRIRKTILYYSERRLGRGCGYGVEVDIPRELAETRSGLLQRKNEMPEEKRLNYHLNYTNDPPFIELIKKTARETKCDSVKCDSN